MFKKVLAVLAALFAAAAFAAVDVNKATQAELESIKGIGPAIAGKILDERKKGSFKDWPDLIDRVKGVGEVNAGKFSADGLTVGGTSYKGATAPAAPVAVAMPAVEPAVPATAATPVAKSAAPAAAAYSTTTAAGAKMANANADAKAEKKAAAKADKDAKKSKGKDAKADKPEAAASAAKK